MVSSTTTTSFSLKADALKTDVMPRSAGGTTASFSAPQEFADATSANVHEMAIALQQAIHHTIAVPIHHDIRYILYIAQQKLESPHVPQLLKLTGYIRMCTHAMQRLSHFGAGEPAPALYAPLLRTLTAIAPNWWEHCEIRPDGVIVSSHPDVQLLLQLLQGFVHRVNTEL